MKREWPTVRRKPNGSYDVDCGKRLTGKRVIYNRKSKAEALVLAEQLRAQRNALGMAALKLSPAQLMDAAGAFDVLLRAGSRATLLTLAHRELNALAEPVESGIARTFLSVAISQRLKSMRGANARERSIQSAGQRLAMFDRARGADGEFCHNITASRIESFLDSYCQLPVTRKSMLSELRAFFAFCLARGYVATNPATAVPMPKIERRTAEFMPAADVERFMHEIEKEDPSLAIYAALGFFAGIRTAELDRLGWWSFSSDPMSFEVGSTAAKARSQRRLVLSVNLYKWFRRCCPGTTGDRDAAWKISHHFNPIRTKICKRLGIAWPSNCMRHTFATYHLAKHQNAEATALELGHTSGTKVLFDHYRGLGTKEDAERFWSIVPKGAS